MSFYVYQNWRVRPHKAMIHAGSCSFCSDGSGRRGDYGDENGKWHGPFDTLDQARAFSARLQGVVDRRECSYCR
jgi:hypothetical protein